MHNTYPQLEEVRSLADKGLYKRIPVMTEILSDSITPIELVKVMCCLGAPSAGVRVYSPLTFAPEATRWSSMPCSFRS